MEPMHPYRRHNELEQSPKRDRETANIDLDNIVQTNCLGRKVVVRRVNWNYPNFFDHPTPPLP